MPIHIPRRHALLLGVLAIIMATSPQARSQDTVTTPDEIPHVPVRTSDTYPRAVVNVRAFGAKGDGKTDDTVAIRNAFTAAHNKRVTPNHPQYGYFSSMVEVYFPSGHYVISDVISNIQYVKIRGENYAAIEQLDPAKDIFHNANAWRQIIEGITFLGGKTQLNLGNANTDNANIIIRDCHFYFSGDAAVLLRKGSNSTLLKLENCIFKRCEQAVISHCDVTAIRDCWISTSPNMKDKAVIENYGVMTVDNLLGVPKVSRNKEGFIDTWVDPTGRTRTASNQRWIDNHGSVHIQNTRFGGEDGGFSAVYNFSEFRYQYPRTPRAVTIQNSWLYCTQSAAIVLKQVPDQLSVTNCQGLVNAWIMRVDPQLDLDTYFDREGKPRDVSIQMANNVGGFGTGLPQQMWPYLEQPMEADQPPRTGNWTRGQVVHNSRVDQFPFRGWICIESGKPGQWRAYGRIEAQ